MSVPGNNNAKELDSLEKERRPTKVTSGSLRPSIDPFWGKKQMQDIKRGINRSLSPTKALRGGEKKSSFSTFKLQKMKSHETKVLTEEHLDCTDIS